MASTVKTGLIEPQYGRILHDAFEARLDSDYGPNPDLTEDSAQQLISNAKNFVERLAQSVHSAQRDGVGYDSDEHVG